MLGPTAEDQSSKWKRWCSIAFHRMKNELLASPSAGAFIDTETQEISILNERKGSRECGAAGGEGDSSWQWLGAYQDWLLVALVGVATAVCAAWIGFVAEHLSDLKFGFCRGLPWLNRELCCGSPAAVDIYGNSCRPVTKFKPNMLTDLGPAGILQAAGIAPDVGADLSAAVGHTVNQSATWLSWSALIAGEAGLWIEHLDWVMYVSIGTFLAYAGGVLVLALAPAAGGSGIPEVKTVLGGFWLKRVMHPWTLIVKTLALALSVASGLGLGKEGPMVHIGAAWASILSYRPSAHTRVHTRAPKNYSAEPSKVNALISAGSAAGVASAFGAPLGGVLFALEEVSTYFPPSTLYKTLFCAVVSAVVLKNVSGARSGNGTIFQLDTLGGSWGVKEIPMFLVIGVLGGVVGAIYIIACKHLTLFRIKCRKKEISVPFLSFIYGGDGLRELCFVGFLANVFNYACPILRVSSIFCMSQLFSRCGQVDPTTGADIFGLCARTGVTGEELLTVPNVEMVTPIDFDVALGPVGHNTSLSLMLQLFVAFSVYGVTAWLTYGTCVPAGLFVPTLTMGSLLGRIIGHVTIGFQTYWRFMKCVDCIHPGAYSLLGAIAVLSGVSRMTVSMVVIAFEMSGGLAYIVPYMLVTLVAKGVSEFITEPSIYDDAIEIKRLPFLHMTPLKSDHQIAFGLHARDIMTAQVVCISLAQQWTVRWILTLLTDFTFSHYPVVSDIDNRIVKGVVSGKELRAAVAKINLASLEYGQIPVSFTAADSDGSALDFSNLVHPVLMIAHPDNNLSHIHHLFVQLGLSYMIFAEEGRLAGVLSKKAFLARLEKLRH
ncbi:chloride channel, protein ClC [Gregarina niphandrodes]|uniref:Chloride channel protein n=1 Tax=Gregarina niphandrodes TaxID=110365 RepID=A0A023BAI4_GRENI|nr:chloride channel, protein ClC [Gregarina niphandrodes]EZG78267.1 chloride channel, protein ClC [Gregarina niphandrodes]|eukprot:XP_011129372.1 chloride channel, protein ClC [Gregarina niphandrodes]